jgi:hypothetical protein
MARSKFSPIVGKNPHRGAIAATMVFLWAA